MATASKQIKQAFSEPRPHQWTREEYYKMGEAGFFREKRVELIEGEVMEMSPIYSLHATAVTIIDEVIRRFFAKGWVVRTQNPLSLGVNSDPQPDIAIVAGKARDFKEAHPTTAALVIEIADTTLPYDRKVKGSLYAKSEIADYWIVNLQKRQVEVYRRPMIDASAKFGYSYADKKIFTEEEFVSPLAKPKTKIAVADLLP